MSPMINWSPSVLVLGVARKGSDSIMHVGHWTPTFESLTLSAIKPIPSEEQPPIPERKPLPSTLKYAFLGEGESYPELISSSRLESQEASLLKMLKKHKRASKILKAKMKSVYDQHILRKSFEVVKISFYTISDYTYFQVSFKVDGPDLSLSKMFHLMGRLKFKIPRMIMFLKSMGID